MPGRVFKNHVTRGVYARSESKTAGIGPVCPRDARGEEQVGRDSNGRLALASFLDIRGCQFIFP